jgi:hypothetical protein
VCAAQWPLQLGLRCGVGAWRHCTLVMLSLYRPRFFPYLAAPGLLQGMFTTSCLNIRYFTVFLSVWYCLAPLPHMCSTSTCTVQICLFLFSSLLPPFSSLTITVYYPFAST